MRKDARLQQILDLLDQRGCITAEYLSQVFFVSLPTVYRDLRELSRRKLILHNHGMVQRAHSQTVTTPFDFRRGVNAAEKAAIAKAAADLIRDHSVIFMDASTTASYLIGELGRFRGLTVLTNGLVTAMLLTRAGIRTYCLGGAPVENSLAVGGPQAMDLLRQFEVDIMLFSAYGVNERGVIVDPSEAEVGLRRYALQNTTSVLLCDRSKFGRSSLFQVAPLSEIDYLVTDAPLTREQAPVRRRIIRV